ncbi:MAG: tRNA (adenosine(37)-N6)-threonylcarbamoyltransferase complex dimerization subunit type 1 TsaB [Candidatus Omnitrophota bacterium]
MLILGIDTSTKMLSLALSDRDRIIFNYKKDIGIKHSVLLLSILDNLLKEYKIRKEDIDLFAVGLGPGSFTGLRISLSMVKGLILVLKKKVLGIPTLDIIARNVIKEGNISVISDARRENIYAASYEYKNAKFKRTMPSLLLNFKHWLKDIKKKTFILGDAVGVYANELSGEKNIYCVLPEKFWYPDAKNLCILALEKFKRQGRDKVEKLVPLYLYPKECQISRKT